jgi:uncharacterized 2Fe-2S/4Fe-4S cluster protein (DUF4445 family)
VRRVEKIETAVEPRFQEHFVEAMAFPHRTAPSTHLSQVTTLPQRGAGPAGGARPDGGGRRRRAVVSAAKEDR